MSDALDRWIFDPAVRAWDWLLELGGDVARWIRTGPRGHGRLLLAWGAATVRTGDLESTLRLRTRELEAADARLANTRRELDDLCLRILEATLDVGAIAQIEVEAEGRYVEDDAAPDGVGYVAQVYPAAQVDRLLETARRALTSAEDLARWAAYRRRRLHAGTTDGDRTLEPAALESILRRIETILCTAGGTEDLEAIDRAAAHVIELLRDVPLRRLPRP